MATVEGKRVLVVGNAVLDVVLRVPHHPAEDEELRASGRRLAPGGNAANTAVALAALGRCPALLAVLAEDAEGTALAGMLARRGVDLAHAVRRPGATPVSYVLLSAATGARTIVHHRDLPELEATDLEAVPLEGFAWVHFEGRNVAALGAMLDHVRRRAPAVRVSLELEKPRPGLEALAGRADLVVAARAYAAARGWATPEAVLAALRARAPRALLVCAWGAAGAVWSAPGGAGGRVPAFRAGPVVDTLGAGDVLNAGLVHGLLAGLDPGEAVARAVRLAGRKCAREGLDGLGPDDWETP